MNEFTMSAFAIYPDDRRGDAFAAVAAPSLVACFAQMAGEVADWLPAALTHGEDPRTPRAIELTLEWSGAPTAQPAREQPAVPSDPACCRPSAPTRTMRCSARRQPSCAGGVGLPIPVALRGAIP